MPSQKNMQEIVLQGVAASPGLAHGPAFVFLQKELDIPLYQVAQEEQDAEIERFEAAIVATREQISRLRETVAEKLGEEEARIFDAHLLVLEDQALIEETVREHKETQNNIEYCFNAVATRYIEAFGRIDDEYIKERVSDIRDVTRRLMLVLLGGRGLSFDKWKDPRVLVSEFMSPSDIAAIDRDKVLALVTNVGSRTSHAVIMARSLQVPAVVGLHDITEKIPTSAEILVDGYEGLVIINPSEQTKFRYSKLSVEHDRAQKLFKEAIELPDRTKDGKAFILQANVESVDDLASVKRNKAQGVGLFRTESLFLKSNEFPTEEQQFLVYKELALGVGDDPVVIRTLDLGGDKRLTSYLFPEEEENPFMGFRAIRFCLEYSDIFKDQLRAILRASAYGNVRLMYPMISGVAEIKQANELLEQAKSELRERDITFNENILVGSMIEIPSAAATADLLAEHCDFFSIGTNDLIQYLLAVDRVNDRIAHLYQPNHPAVLRIIKHIVEVAQKHNLPVSVCGEMAGDPIYVPFLIGIGVNQLSLTPSVLPEIKYLLCNMRQKHARALAKKILKESDSKVIFNSLREFYFKQAGDILAKLY